MRNHEIAGITIITAISATLCAYGIADLFGFPIPFTITSTAPLSMTCFTACLALRWGRLVRHDSGLRLNILEYVIFTCAQFTITLVYPVLAYIFIRADSVVLETMIACILPIIKWLFRRLLGHALRHSPSTRSPLIIFSIDVFHAFFIACCLQNASSWVTTATIVSMDIAFMLMTFRRLTRKLVGISSILDEAKTRHDQNFPPSHKLDLLDCVTFLSRGPPSTGTITSQVLLTSNTTRTLTQVMPSPPPEATVLSPLSSSNVCSPSSLDAADKLLLSSLDPERKAALASGILRLLDSIEYTALAEYIEVVVPAVYAVYLAVVYELPNRIYYPQLRSLTPTAHAHAINSVLVYVAFEMASFAILECVVRRKTKLSPLRQLSFVLSHHGGILPWELVLWVSFVVQCALEHYGNDYSFKFTWLRARSAATDM